jgi:murein DD-endopeptidase MepM/ murein hydrolase activator NlpD
MAHARSRIRTLALTTAVAALGALAVAAVTPVDAHAGPSPTVGFAGLPAWAARLADHREAGPFLPLVGKLDYGTAENAFGADRSGHTHEGQDIFAAAGTPEVAPVDAVVAETGSDGGQGNYIYLYDEKRDRTYVYMHMISPSPRKVGERVKARELVGRLGCTGSCWGDHLHFEVRDGKGIVGTAHDPMPLLRDWKPLDKAR